MTGACGDVSIARRCLAIGAAALMVTALGACRGDEQGRPLTYEKGVYGGQPDESLSEEQRRELNRRAASSYN